MKAESESLLIILESHGELKDPGEGLEIQQNDEDSFNFHAESLNQDYAGVDPLSLDFDTGKTNIFIHYKKNNNNYNNLTYFV